jgi:mono/diheme cytochrome c family protein
VSIVGDRAFARAPGRVTIVADAMNVACGAGNDCTATHLIIVDQAANAPVAERRPIGTPVPRAGNVIFGSTTCFTCHGAEATGTPLGPNLTDAEWLNGNGTLEDITRIIREGVPSPKQHPAPMPPMGGADLSEGEIDAVARYVLGLRVRRPPPYWPEDLLSLIRANMSANDIMNEIGRGCLSFRIDEAFENTLLDAGADDALIRRLRSVCLQYPPELRPATVRIIGDLPAGWTRVVNRTPPSTQRTVTLTPGRLATIIVTAPGFCAAALQVTMSPGEQRNWEPILRPRRWLPPAC